MIFTSSSGRVTVRIEVLGGNFDGPVGDKRKRTFRSAIQFLVAIGIAKPAQLCILADELTRALIRCLGRVKRGEENFEAGTEEGTPEGGEA